MIGPGITEIIQAWRVCATTDDRGSAGAALGIYTSEIEAGRNAEGKGYFNGMGVVRPCTLLRVDLDYYVLDDAHPEPVRINTDFQAERRNAVNAAQAAATASLSEEQRKLLGLEF